MSKRSVSNRRIPSSRSISHRPVLLSSDHFWTDGFGQKAGGKVGTGVLFGHGV
jgi:hypothetical protein